MKFQLIVISNRDVVEITTYSNIIPFMFSFISINLQSTFQKGWRNTLAKLIFRIRHDNYVEIPFEHSNMLVYVLDEYRRNFYHFDFYTYQDEMYYQYFRLNYRIHSRLKTTNIFDRVRIEDGRIERFLERYKRECE